MLPSRPILKSNFAIFSQDMHFTHRRIQCISAQAEISSSGYPTNQIQHQENGIIDPTNQMPHQDSYHEPEYPTHPGYDYQTTNPDQLLPPLPRRNFVRSEFQIIPSLHIDPHPNFLYEAQPRKICEPQ